MGKKRFKGEIGYSLLTPIMRVLFRLYYNPKIINKEVIPKEGPILIVGNHKHIYDQCLTIMATKRVIHYMAKKEYFDGKMAWFFKLVGCIPVDRSIKDHNATDKALKVLNSGGAIGLFPEGTRNKTKDVFLLPFKFGTVSMAKKTNATIIPFGLTGDYKFRSKNLTIRYGTPFKVGEMDLDDANKKLYEEVERLMRENLEGEEK
ncbi:1-acyl-sn-glycerol-3-phosphate acyltransferase [Clostridium sp. CAG:451]|nr:1-acyl-sn-glycerol-3-phosphate acyltransferase [Clostridium sp. CAG:451]